MIKKIIGFPLTWVFYWLYWLFDYVLPLNFILDRLIVTSMLIQDWADLDNPWTLEDDPYDRLHETQDRL